MVLLLSGGYSTLRSTWGPWMKLPDGVCMLEQIIFSRQLVGMGTGRVWIGGPYSIPDPQLEGPSPSPLRSPLEILDKEPNLPPDGDRGFSEYTHIQTKKYKKSSEIKLIFLFRNIISIDFHRLLSSL